MVMGSGTWVCTTSNVPFPHERVGDVRVGAAGGATCGTAADCSYAGVCADGKCICDPAWTGAKCEALDLRPAKPNGGFNAAVAYGQCDDVRNCSS